jgi:hypothetical protein
MGLEDRDWFQEARDRRERQEIIRRKPDVKYENPEEKNASEKPNTRADTIAGVILLVLFIWMIASRFLS